MSWVLSVPNTNFFCYPRIIQDASEDTRFIAEHGLPVYLYYRRIFIDKRLIEDGSLVDFCGIR